MKVHLKSLEKYIQNKEKTTQIKEFILKTLLYTLNIKNYENTSNR